MICPSLSLVLIPSHFHSGVKGDLQITKIEADPIDQAQTTSGKCETKVQRRKEIRRAQVGREGSSKSASVTSARLRNYGVGTGE